MIVITGALFTTTVNVGAFAVAEVTQVALEVSWQSIVSPLFRLEVV